MEGEFHLMLLNRRIHETEEILNKSDIEAEVILKLLDDIDFQYKKCVDLMSINSKNKDQINATINRVKNRCKMKLDRVISKNNNQKTGFMIMNMHD